jgi:drug/metabolite transporter (DMT)-like permease
MRFTPTFPAVQPLLSRWTALPAVTRGCALMLLSTIMFAGMHAAIRHTTQFVPPVEVAFFRNLFGLIVIAPLLMRYGAGVFRTNKLNLHILRAVLNVISMLAFFVGLSMTPIARATALSFTAPLFTALLGVVFLGEVFRWRRWTAILVGFIGALVILRPTMAGLETGAVLIVVSSLLWALAVIDIKVLARTESSLTITAYVTVLMIPLTLFPAISVWQMPPAGMWGWLIFIGVIGTIGQFVVTEALKLADTTALMPFDFLKLIWAAMLGVFVFGEHPDVYTWIGAAIVFGSSFYIAWRETVLRREKKQLDVVS